MRDSRGVGRRSPERGSVMIELSLLLPILVGLFIGTWSLGFSNYRYAELEQAIRAGARYASHGVYNAATPTVYRDAVRNAVVYGDPAGGTTALVPDLTTAMVNVTLSPSTGSPLSVTVSISGYGLAGPFGTTVTLNNKPQLTLPFMGYYVPVL